MCPLSPLIIKTSSEITFMECLINLCQLNPFSGHYWPDKKKLLIYLELVPKAVSNETLILLWLLWKLIFMHSEYVFFSTASRTLWDGTAPKPNTPLCLCNNWWDGGNIWVFNEDRFQSKNIFKLLHHHQHFYVVGIIRFSCKHGQAIEYFCAPLLAVETAASVLSHPSK